ncbi:hypothetical protein [Cellvibrio sp. KY-GH-1]|nr:hypothetical protein [Cellvibrio sp. KY-GH-1]
MRESVIAVPEKLKSWIPASGYDDEVFVKQGVVTLRAGIHEAMTWQ